MTTEVIAAYTTVCPVEEAATTAKAAPTVSIPAAVVVNNAAGPTTTSKITSFVYTTITVPGKKTSTAVGTGAYTPTPYATGVASPSTGPCYGAGCPGTTGTTPVTAGAARTSSFGVAAALVGMVAAFLI